MIKGSCIVDNLVRKKINSSNYGLFAFLAILGACGVFVFSSLSVIMSLAWIQSMLVFTIPLVLGSYALLIKNQDYKKTKKIVDINTYYFEEDAFTVVTKRYGEQIAQITFFYREMFKAKETKDFILLYPNKNVVYPVDKQVLSEENLFTLRNYLGLEDF